MAEVPFRPVRQLSEYKGKGASASREIKEQRNLKTVKKTDCKTFTFIQRKYSETRSLTEIPPNIIVGYLSHFITEVGKADSGEYEPDSLTNFRNSIQRLLTTVQVLAH